MPLAMPPIVYGCAWKGADTTSLVVRAVLAGFRGVDTACQPKHYREEGVGEAIKLLREQHGVAREELFIQTKFTPISSQDPNLPLPYDVTASVPERVRQSLARSMLNLDGTPPDSVLLHGLMPTMEETLQVLLTLDELRREGKILSLTGISNTYDCNTLNWLVKRGAKIDVVQNRWFEGNGWDADVYGAGARRSGWFEGRSRDSVQYQSFWTLTGSPSLLRSSPLLDLARRKGLTPSQTVYGLCQLWGITPLCGAKTPAHVAEALAVQGWTWEPSEGEAVARWMSEQS